MDGFKIILSIVKEAISALEDKDEEVTHNVGQRQSKGKCEKKIKKHGGKC